MLDLSEMRCFENGFTRGREVGVEETIYRILEILQNNATGNYKIVMLTPQLISEIEGENK